MGVQLVRVVVDVSSTTVLYMGSTTNTDSSWFANLLCVIVVPFHLYNEACNEGYEGQGHEEGNEG